MLNAARLLLLSGLWCGVALGQAAAPAESVVLRGDTLAAASASLRNSVNDYTQRSVYCLAGLGVPVRIASDTDLTLDTIAGAPLVVLPYNRVEPATVDVLAAYVAAGGRLIAMFTTGDGVPALGQLLGVTIGELMQPATEGEFETIVLDPAAVAADTLLPAAFRQESWNAFELTPAEGTSVLGRWGVDGRAAITQNAAGCFVGHVLTGADLPNKARFLLAQAITAEPELWTPVINDAQTRLTQAVEYDLAQLGLLRERGDRQSARLHALAAKVEALLVPLPAVDDRAAQLDNLLTREGEAVSLLAELQPSREHELRGLWVFGARQDWPALIAKCQAAGLNAIFYRVGRGGNAIYPSDILPQDEWARENDPVAEGLAACRAAGIEFHAWRVTYHLGSAPQDYRDQLRAEGRISVNPAGVEAPFANPGDPRNYALEVAVAREFLERYDVDGLHLDYIRYTDEPSYEFDYSDVSRQEFGKVLGTTIDPADWPGIVVDGRLRMAYNEWMRSNIDRLVEANHRLVNELRPHAVLSIAAWRDPRWDRVTIMQDWPKWVEQGWVDLLIPMNYATSLVTLDGYVTRQLAQTAGNTRYASGLGAWLLDSPAELLEQVALSRAGGADGFVLFSNNAPDLDRQLHALAAGATHLPAQPTTVGPHARFTVNGLMSADGEPNGVALGGTNDVTVEIGPRWGTLRADVARFTARLHLVDPARDRLLGLVGEISAEGPSAVLNARFEPIRDPFQLLLSGTITDTAGAEHTYEIRGPLLRGWSAEQTVAWQAAQQPVTTTGAPLRVGVWHDGIGTSQLLAALGGVEGLEAHQLWRFTPEFLAPFNVVIVPQVRNMVDLADHAAGPLRAWVEAGGRLILTHDAVGRGYQARLYPEIGLGAALQRTQTVTATDAWPTPGTFDHLYATHVRIAPGPAGQALLTDADGAPVVVGGRVGEGLVILDGMMTGYVGDNVTVPDAERQFLLDALRWTP